MQKTSKKHWQNGYSVRGKYFHQLAFNLYFFGFILSWISYPNIRNIKLNIYKLK